MIGRAFLDGLGARGEEGVERALDILLAEMDRAMALLGRPTIAELDRTAVNTARLFLEGERRSSLGPPYSIGPVLEGPPTQCTITGFR